MCYWLGPQVTNERMTLYLFLASREETPDVNEIACDLTQTFSCILRYRLWKNRGRPSYGYVK